MKKNGEEVKSFGCEGKGRGLKDLTFIGSNGIDLLDSVRRSLIVCRLCWRSFFFKFKNLRSEKKKDKNRE